VRFSDPVASETRQLHCEKQFGRAFEKWQGEKGTVTPGVTNGGSGLTLKLWFGSSYQPDKVSGLNVHQARELLREVDELQDTLRDLVAELEKVVQRGDEERVTL
jgi:hypothetical protein